MQAHDPFPSVLVGELSIWLFDLVALPDLVPVRLSGALYPALVDLCRSPGSFVVPILMLPPVGQWALSLNQCKFIEHT